MNFFHLTAIRSYGNFIPASEFHDIRTNSGIPAVSEYIPDNGGVEGSVFRGSEEKNCFNFRIKLFIDLPDTSFKFKIS